MFNNIGGKIKSLAKIVCWLGIISCIISGLPLILTNQQPLVLVGILIAVVGSLFSWISLFILYGFGELVENSAIIAAKSKQHQLKLMLPKKLLTTMYSQIFHILISFVQIAKNSYPIHNKN